jgi:hypothetical protein
MGTDSMNCYRTVYSAPKYIMGQRRIQYWARVILLQGRCLSQEFSVFRIAPKCLHDTINEAGLLHVIQYLLHNVTNRS